MYKFDDEVGPFNKLLHSIITTLCKVNAAGKSLGDILTSAQCQVNLQAELKQFVTNL